MLLQLAGVKQPPHELTPEEAADIGASLAEVERGDYVAQCILH
jgi:hypothetical protein